MTRDRDCRSSNGPLAATVDDAACDADDWNPLNPKKRKRATGQNERRQETKE